MLYNLRWTLLALLLLVCLASVSGCATQPPPLQPAVVAPPSIPPLPREARQPPIPSECLPSCAANLMTQKKRALDTLTRLQQPGAFANSSTKD